MQALREIEAEGKRGASANELAHRAGIQGHRRLGNGAVKGSWSGYTSPALAAASSLTGLVRAGVLWTRDNGRHAIYMRVGE